MEGDMGIRAITPTNPAAPAAPGLGVPNTSPPQAVERNLHDTLAGPSRAAPAGQERPQIAHTHAELAFDGALNRVSDGS